MNILEDGMEFASSGHNKIKLRKLDKNNIILNTNSS